MKNIQYKIHNIAKMGLLPMLVFLMLLVSTPVMSQDADTEKEVKEVKKEKPARPAFESSWWFDGQTGVVYNKNTFEYVIQHRFGKVNSGNRDLLGLYGPSNIRMGLAYTPINKLSVGLGLTKNKMILDLNAKYSILTQTRSNSTPLTLSYYVNMGIEILEKENYLNPSDRYNFLHQLFIMKRFSSNFSAQIAPSVSHYNAVKWEEQTDGSWETMENDTWAVSAGIRYKLSGQMNMMLGYDHPLTHHDINDPKPSINIGLEIATSSHAFQIFATNNNRIQTQENFTFNQNDFGEGDWLIGFNITRLWSF